jgi:hypothetical protein
MTTLAVLMVNARGLNIEKGRVNQVKAKRRQFKAKILFVFKFVWIDVLVVVALSLCGLS